jgi:hypothetical protein
MRRPWPSPLPLPPASRRAAPRQMYRVELQGMEPVRVPAQEAFSHDRRPAGIWRGIAGAFAAGLCALAIALIAAQVVSADAGAAGPGVAPVAGHAIAGVLAVAAAGYADRRRGIAAAAGVFGALAVTAVALWLFWWS